MIKLSTIMKNKTRKTKTPSKKEMMGMNKENKILIIKERGKMVSKKNKALVDKIMKARTKKTMKMMKSRVKKNTTKEKAT